MKISINKNNLSELDEVITLSVKVFHPSAEQLVKYHDNADWIKKIENGGLLLSALIKNKIVGFVICYRKSPDILHIWNVGIDEEYRRMGIWNNLYNEILDWAKQKNYKYVSLNTYKQKFPNMFTFAIKNNFVLDSEEVVDNTVKSRFIVRL